MLVLSRKQKQQIRIGDDVVVTVLQIKGGAVRIGIEAPRSVHVMRGELEDFREAAVSEETQEAAWVAGPTGASGSQQNNGDSAAAERVLELRFEGGNQKGKAAPTRLTEIASSVLSPNLPR